MVCEKAKSLWKTLNEDGLYSCLFVEPSREKKIKKGRNRFVDIFLYSKTKDYRLLRFLYNFPFGFLLSLLVYHLAWYKINFAADTRFIPSFWAFLVKYFLIGFAALSFSLNSLIRCSIIFAILSGLSSSGQGVISIYVMENLRLGPIQNIMVNFGHSTKITLCHLELQARVAKRRMQIQAGPLEMLFEKHFGNATSIGNKVVKMLRSLVQPYDGEIDSDSTEDDKHLSAIIDTAEALATRKLKTYGEDKDENGETKVDRVSQPVLKRLKSHLTKAIYGRFMKRCKLMFASSVTSCHKKFEESQSLCYDTIPFPIHYFTCSAMNSLTLCKPDRFKIMSHKYCELGQVQDAARGTHETFVRWIVLLFVVFAVVMLDYYYNRMLEIVIEHGKMLSEQTSYSHLNIKVDGEGVVANLLKEILNFNYTGYLKEELTNEKCLKNASSKPDWFYNFRSLFLPVFLILLLMKFF
uniref:Dendritic cell-specific transmembrane protein-like domain-containing protein n=1 Tax=Meloidogyne javanica TaxID=6303 RepID=A0A915N6T7_MELJA